MTRVAVVFPPLRVSRDFIDYPYFADLGAVQAAAVLREAGHEVALVDALARPGATLAPLDPGYVRLGVEVADALAAVPAFDVAIVAYTPFHRPPARDPLLAEVLAGLRAQRPDAPVALADLYQSGQHVVDVPSAQILAAYPEADAILRYEAEADLDALVRELAASGRPAAPFERRGKEPSPLDRLPLPAWDLVDLEAYWGFHAGLVAGLGRPSWAFPIDGRALPMLSTRGCPFRCTHCSSNPGRAAGQPKTQRRYSPTYLARLLDDLAARGARRVHLLDELANVNEAHFDALLAALDARGLAFEIPNGVRADYVEPKHLAAMRGKLTTLSVSAESGDARVVDEVVDKQLDLGAIRAAAERAQAHGIPLLVHFMIGLPGETKQDIQRTLAWALELHETTGAWPSVQFATPLPGTRLAEMAERRGRVLPMVEDWGPHFQRAPSIATGEFELADLVAFRDAFERRVASARAPRTLVLRPTHRCNDRCAFCATASAELPDRPLRLQQESLLAHAKRGVRRLAIDGGEPTLHPHLVELVRFARRAGYEQVALTTNARLASYADYAGRLARSGATSIDVSIHGADAATHDALVGVPGAFEQTVAGARNLVAAAPAGVAIGARTAVTASNLGQLRAVAELAVELGVRALVLDLLVPSGRGAASVAPDARAAADAAVAVARSLSGRLEVRLANAPYCLVPGAEDLVDAASVELESARIEDDGAVAMDAYVRSRRVRIDACAACPRALVCGGLFAVEGAPEPPWLVEAARLARGAVAP